MEAGKIYDEEATSLEESVEKQVKDAHKKKVTKNKEEAMASMKVDKELKDACPTGDEPVSPAEEEPRDPAESLKEGIREEVILGRSKEPSKANGKGSVNDAPEKKNDTSTNFEDYNDGDDNPDYFTSRYGEFQASQASSEAGNEKATTKHVILAGDNMDSTGSTTDKSTSQSGSTPQGVTGAEKGDVAEVEYSPATFPFDPNYSLPRFLLETPAVEQNNLKLTCQIEKLPRFQALTIRIKSRHNDFENVHPCLTLMEMTTSEELLREIVRQSLDAFIKFTHDLTEFGKDHAFRTMVIDTTKQFLLRHHIHFLEKPPTNPQYKTACFFCQFCKHHIFTTGQCREHLFGPDHEKSLEKYRLRKALLEDLPKLKQSHFDKMEEQIRRILSKREDGPDGSKLAHSARRIVGYVEDSIREVADRAETIGGIDASTAEIFRDYSKWDVQLYGSALVGLDESDPEDVDGDRSDINLHLSAPTITTRHFSWSTFFDRVAKTMEERAESCNISPPKNAQYTLKKTFEFQTDCFKVVMRINCPEKILLSQAIEKWSGFRAGLVTFLRWIRKWATICGLVEKARKKTPGVRPHNVDLFALHFLLQKGLIPNIFKHHEVLHNEGCPRTLPEFEDPDEIKTVSGEDRSLLWNLGELFHDFLEYYVRERNSLYIHVNDNKRVNSLSLSSRRVTIMEPNGNIVGVSLQVYNHIFNVILYSFCYIKVANFPTPASLVYLTMKTPNEKSKDKKQKGKKDADDAWREDHLKHSGSNEQGEKAEDSDGIVWKYNYEELKKDGLLMKNDISYSIYSRQALFQLLAIPQELLDQCRDDLLAKEFAELFGPDNWPQFYAHAENEYVDGSAPEVDKSYTIEPAEISTNDEPNKFETEEETRWGCENIDTAIDFGGSSTKEIHNAGHVAFFPTVAPGDPNKLEAIGMNRTSDVDMDATAGRSFVPQKISYEDFGIAIKQPELLSTVERNEDYDFENVENFTGGYVVDGKCTICNSTEHFNANCPELERPAYVELPPPPKCIFAQVSKVINVMFERDAVTENEAKKVESKVESLQSDMNHSHLARLGCGNIRLDLFGSYCNRVGVRSSDVDICLTFEDHPQTKPDKVDPQNVMRRITGALTFCRFTDHVMPVYRAKVPIVQFKLHLDSNFDKRYTRMVESEGKVLEADVSYYNTLAMHNSKLLATYCELWPPLRKLGIFIKAWAKDNFIGNAACGSISSYGHMLMLIHFLQQRNYLPVLTESPWLSANAPRQMCEGFDVTFLDQEHLPKMAQKMIWAATSKTIGEVFLDYLDFYAKYDFSNQVIQIRTRREVTIEEKREDPEIRLMVQWSMDRSMYIEDPFERTHNLPSGVRERMIVYIIRCFAHTREKLWKAQTLNPIIKPNHQNTKKANPLNKISKPSTQDRGDTKEQIELESPEKLLAYCRNPKTPPESREICKNCFQQGHYAGNCPKKDDGFVPRKFGKRVSKNDTNNGFKPEAGTHVKNAYFNRNREFVNRAHKQNEQRSSAGPVQPLMTPMPLMTVPIDGPGYSSQFQPQLMPFQRPGHLPFEMEAIGGYQPAVGPKLSPQKGSRGVFELPPKLLLQLQPQKKNRPGPSNSQKETQQSQEARLQHNPDDTSPWPKLGARERPYVEYKSHVVNKESLNETQKSQPNAKRNRRRGGKSNQGVPPPS